ncbi:MAG: hypothetical protein WEB13_04360, partial [Dehalococcoidia bacterium]
DPELRHARPKRLRFAVFTQFGRVVHHARGAFMRLRTPVLETLIRPAWTRLRGAAWPAAA